MEHARYLHRKVPILVVPITHRCEAITMEFVPVPSSGCESAIGKGMKIFVRKRYGGERKAQEMVVHVMQGKLSQQVVLEYCKGQ